MAKYQPRHLSGSGEIFDEQCEAKYILHDPMQRTLWRSFQIDKDDGELDGYEDDFGRVQCTAGDANLVSSLTAFGTHAPALDIDFNARLIPSRTKGHFHLYLDRQLPWWKYRVLLKVLAWVGIIEPGYYRASVRRKMTHLRWRVEDWWDGSVEQQMVVADLLQISRQTGTVQPTEPKET